MDERIMYLCNGEKLDCKKTHCYKNTDDDPCRHTSDINYAINFCKKVYGSHIRYWETDHDIQGCMVGNDLRNEV